MDMQEACRLAKHIENSVTGIQVLAVGRFVPPDELASGLPWKISVVMHHETRPKVIESASDLGQIIDAMPKPKKPSKPKQRQPAAAAESGMLF